MDRGGLDVRCRGGKIQSNPANRGARRESNLNAIIQQQHPTKPPCLLFLPFTMEMTGQYRAPAAPGFWEPIYAVAPRTHQFSQETTTNAAQKEPVSLGRPPSRSRARISSSVLVNEAVPTASQIVCHCTSCKEPSHRAAEGRHDS
ncbi:hypothetical protein B0H13DRAFT_2670294, partial [Mycena leptocephala]